MDASLHGHVSSVRVLVQGGANVRLRSHVGESALHVAARNGPKDVFVLLMTGSDLRAKDVSGLSAL